MSNWSRAKVNFKNMTKELLDEALANMGYYADFDIKTVPGAYSIDGNRDCDCMLMNTFDDTPANIGLKFERAESGEVVVNVIGDWYNKKYNDRTFTQALTLEYTTANMTQQARLNGYSVEQTEMVDNYKRRIVFVRAA